MIFTGKQACNFIKKKLQRICFPVNIAKLLRVPILKNICERLLLLSKKYVAEYKKLIHGCFGKQRLYSVGAQFFLTAIWLPHGKLWAIIEGTASLTQC